MKVYNKIMAKFTQTISDLKALHEKKQIEEEKIQDKITNLSISKDSIVNEGAAALNMANKLEDIFTL